MYTAKEVTAKRLISDLWARYLYKDQLSYILLGVRVDLLMLVLVTSSQAVQQHGLCQQQTKSEE